MKQNKTTKNLIFATTLMFTLVAFSILLSTFNKVSAAGGCVQNVYGTYGISTCAPTGLFDKNDPRVIAPQDVVILSSTVGLGALSFLSGKALRNKISK